MKYFFYNFIFRALKSFPCDVAMSSRFDGKGTRLLCSETNQPLTSYLVAPQWPADTGKMQFTAESYRIEVFTLF